MTHIEKKIYKTRPIGRLLRMALGIFFITEVMPVYLGVSFEGILIRLTWAIALFIFYISLHYFILKFELKINSFIGAILAFAPFLSVFF